MKFPISVNLIVRNEEDRLRLLLPILDEYFDEIIAVDQDSTDDTVYVLDEYAHQILSDKATGYADSSRQLALDSSSNKWILTIDADEVPTHRFIKDMGEFINADYGIDAEYRDLREHSIICCVADVEPTAKLLPYEIVMQYGDTYPLPKHKSIRMQTRLVRKENLLINDHLHGGVGIKDGTTCLYWHYNGIIQFKTIAERVRSDTRYLAVELGKYDPDIHL